MISITSTNPNYLAKVVVLGPILPIEGADRIKKTVVDFNTVVVGADTKEGDVCVYFPLECTIDKSLLGGANLYRDKTLNANPENKGGFFEKHGRVRAQKLRDVPSQGFLLPVSIVEGVLNCKLSDSIGKEFDTVNGSVVVSKYVPANTRQQGEGKQPQKGKKRESILVDGQVRLHIDTSHLKRNIHKINPSDSISISYKQHGSSFWTSNLLRVRQLNWRDRLARFFGVKVQETEYGPIYGSRKVIKNEFKVQNSNHYYGTDIWKAVNDLLAPIIPETFTLYGEVVGYTKEGGAIQKGYDYGCAPESFEVYIYRITSTNPSGQVFELSTSQIKEFCDKNNIKTPPIFYQGKAGDMYPELSNLPLKEFQEAFLNNLIRDFNEKDCFMCVTKVPEEGIILRKEGLYDYDVYKLKSQRFLEWETKELDNNEQNIEDQE